MLPSRPERWRAAGRSARARRLRHRSRDHRGRLRRGAGRSRALDPRPRVARPRARGARRIAASRRRSRGRHRAPSRSGPLPGLRDRPMGHVPQRALHRARHQGAERLRRGALAHRAGVRRQGRSRARPRRACCSSRPASSPRRGTTSIACGGSPMRRRAALLVTGAGPIGLLAALLGVQRGFDVHVYDRNASGPKPELVARARRAPITRASSMRCGKLAPDIVIECTGAPRGHRGAAVRMSRRTASSASPASARRTAREFDIGAVQPHHGAQQRHRVRHRQRQPPPLRAGRRCARARRPRLARRA